jgi:hypothetical protein
MGTATKKKWSHHVIETNDAMASGELPHVEDREGVAATACG